MDWSAIYMRNVFDAGPFLVGLRGGAVRVLAGDHALLRRQLRRPALAERRRARAALRDGRSACCSCSFRRRRCCRCLASRMLGIGTSAIFPLAISAAAQRTDRPAAINVAALAQISFVIFLLGPPLLGFVAEHWGIRWAFGLGMPLVVLSFLMAGALGRKPPSGEREHSAQPAQATRACARRARPKVHGCGRISVPPIGIDGGSLQLQLVAPRVQDVERVAHAARRRRAAPPARSPPHATLRWARISPSSNGLSAMQT